MASYILDSNTLTLLKYKQPRVLNAVERHHKEHVIAVTCVSVDEYLTGWYAKYRRVKTAEQKAIASSGLAEALRTLRQYLA